MRAAKVPFEQRILLINFDRPLTPWSMFRTLYLTRWCGQLPKEGVLTPTGGMKCGACGHYSFFRWRFLLHRHPELRPVPEDMLAAIRGEAPVPEWFKQGRPPE